MADRNVTNRALAEIVDIHETNVSNLKRRDSMPRIDGETLEKLCDALECTPSELIEYTPPQWTKRQELKVLYLQKFGITNLPYSSYEEVLKDLATSMERTIAAVKMRMKNHQFLIDGKGLSNCSQQTKDIHRKYNDYSEVELRELTFSKYM